MSLGFYRWSRCVDAAIGKWPFKSFGGGRKRVDDPRLVLDRVHPEREEPSRLGARSFQGSGESALWSLLYDPAGCSFLACICAGYLCPGGRRKQHHGGEYV